MSSNCVFVARETMHNLCLATILLGCISQSYARTERFLSRPHQSSIGLDIKHTSHPSRLAPGYIWLTPYRNFLNRKGPDNRYGPHIYDQEGNLIWWGNYTIEERGWGCGPCDFDGQEGEHICFNDGDFIQQGGHSAGIGRVFDNTYTEVKRYGPAGGMIGPDCHEMNSPPGQGGMSVIQDVYQTTMMDLSEWGGKEDGYILNCCFQDRDAQTGDVLFQWCAGEHFSPENTYVWLAGQHKYAFGAGDGNQRFPWDYFHLNAVDRDEFGDYYVSGRNSWVVLKVAGPNSLQGPPGSIIWQLGGRNNEFLQQPGVKFSFQHHVRVLSVGPRETVISLFDNSFDGFAYPATSNHSNGKVITVNNYTMVAELTEYFPHPEEKLSGFAGSCQARLPNGNTFMGWGLMPGISEHAAGAPGELLFYATFGEQHELESYRNWKAPWKGYPTEPPDIFAYQESCNADLMVYMSWNGATEVRGWRVLVASTAAEAQSHVGRAVSVSNAESSGGKSIIGGSGSIWPRMGFETLADLGTLPAFPRFIYAEALDANDKVLGTSKPVMVFVPKDAFAQEMQCNSTRCDTWDKYETWNSKATSCLK